MPETRLGDLLAASVPVSPVTLDGVEVLRRARRRSRLRMAAAVATATPVVVGLVVLAGALSDNPHPDVPGTSKPPAPTADAPATPGTPPDVVGLDVDAAFTALGQADCMGSVGAIVPDRTAAVGQVVAQRTASDLCEVALTVSAGSAASAPACTSLVITAGVGGVGLGHAGFPLYLRNGGSASCSLAGYARVTATDSVDGHTVVAVDTPSGYLGGTDLPVPTYVLRPGDEVSALVEGTDVPVGDARTCSSLVHLRVTVNGVTASVGNTLSNCSGMQVHPFVPGRTGSAR